MRALYPVFVASLLSVGCAWDSRMDTSPKIATRDNKVIVNAIDAEFALDGADFSIKDFKTTVDQGLFDAAADITAQVASVREDLSASASTLAAELGTNLDTSLGEVRGSVVEVNRTVQRVARQVNGLDILTPAAFAEGLASSVGGDVHDLLCAINRGRNSVYSAANGGSCVCPADRRWDPEVGECVSVVGLGLTEALPGIECSTILRKWPGAPSGRYWIRPGERMAAPMPTYAAFPAYCDMETQGGGWTLIESYDIQRRGDFRQKPFHANYNLPRQSNSPPSDYESNSAWDNYRMSSQQMMPLLERSVEFHARCDRNASRSGDDWMVGDSAAIRLTRLNGYAIKPRKSAYNVFSMRGRLRRVELGELNLRWYHASSSGSPWHAGFDVGSEIPGSKSSEDDFTWHDGGLNPEQHRCHHTDGDITWWVRGPADLGSVENPAMSCQHILKADPSTRGADGAYWLMLPKNGLTNVYCEMTTHEGGWTMWAGADFGVQMHAIPSNTHTTSISGRVGISKARPGHLGYNPNFKLSAQDINFIRESYRVWGHTVTPPFAPNEFDASYWMVTPTSGQGYWGAESFHPQSCRYQANRLSGALKKTTCVMNRWWYSMDAWSNDQSQRSSDKSRNPFGRSDSAAFMTKGAHMAWLDGGHWWDNNPSYLSWSGYHNEGDHSSGPTCYPDGRGLGYHGGGYSPFHRGWCRSRAWGLEFVRG